MTFYRRNLPHWHPEGKTLFLTWRLYGSLPVSALRVLTASRSRINMKASATNPQNTAKNGCATDDSPGTSFELLDAALDKGNSGPRWLADREIAAYTEWPILRFAELGRYVLHAYVIMPNHVHMLLEPRVPLAKITGLLKGVAARDANATLDRIGKPFWQDETFDHWLRNSANFERIRHYIEWNPVSAGLAAKPEDWEWSSASRKFLGRSPIPGCVFAPLP